MSVIDHEVDSDDDLVLSGVSMEKISCGYYTPTCDIKETKKYLVVEVELPGVLSSDINIEIGGGSLDIRGEHNKEEKHKRQKYKYIRKERMYGKFKKSIPIDISVSSGQVRASFNDGLLTLEIPRPRKQVSMKKEKIRLI